MSSILFRYFQRINIKAFIGATLLFTIVPAFYVWNSKLFPFFAFLFSLFFLLDVFKSGIDKNKIFVAFLFFSIYIVYGIRAELTIIGLLLVLGILCFILSKPGFKKDTYHAFVQLFAILMGISLIIYILVVLLGINIPHSEIPPLNKAKTEVYYEFPFLVVTESKLTGYGVRFLGWFDEPGMVGTLCAIILLTERFNLRKKNNIIVLLCGFFSMSFFFFVICGVYLLLFSSLKYKIVATFVILSLFVLLYENEIVYNVILSRFLFDDGELAGMNRDAGNFDLFYEQFRQTSAYWTGLGTGVGEVQNAGGSSYKQIIVDYGVIFFVFYLACFCFNVMTIFKKEKKLYVIYSLFFLGTMYQRPFIGDTALTFLMIVSPYILIENSYYSKEKYE